MNYLRIVKITFCREFTVFLILDKIKKTFKFWFWTIPWWTRSILKWRSCVVVIVICLFNEMIDHPLYMCCVTFLSYSSWALAHDKQRTPEGHLIQSIHSTTHVKLFKHLHRWGNISFVIWFCLRMVSGTWGLRAMPRVFNLS